MSSPTLNPRDASDAAEIIAGACARSQSLEIVGGGRCRDYGRPVLSDAMLDLSSLAGVLVYEPAELVLTARAATPLSDIDAVLRARGQHFAFEPPDLGPLWGRPAGGGTIGGCLMLGLGGPRRASAGAPRDHFLGFKAINGYAEAFCAGGRVVKNVTGFDLPKLFAGSLGTLGVLTEVTLKVMPRPPFTLTVALAGLTDEAAVAVLARAANSPAAVTAGAHLPAKVAACSKIAALATARGAVTVLRLEGFEPSVEWSAGFLVELLGDLSVESFRIEAQDSLALWSEIGSVAYFTGDMGKPVWRLSVPPSEACALTAIIAAETDAAYYFDCYGGVIWLQLPAATDGMGSDLVREKLVRGALIRDGKSDGHATLVRAPASDREKISPFQPLSPQLAALMGRVKRQFDPLDIFNRGRLGG